MKKIIPRNEGAFVVRGLGLAQREQLKAAAKAKHQSMAGWILSAIDRALEEQAQQT